MRFSLTFLFFLIGFSSISFSQDHLIEHKAKSEQEPHFRFAALILHTFIPTDTPSGPDVLILPTIGLDIEYWFNHKWAIGLHNDIELESFEVETEEGVFVNRKTPIVFTLDTIWRPKKNWVFLAGPGIEIESDKNYALFRLGVEYEFEFIEGIDLSPNLVYDIRNDAFDTFSYGLGVGFRF